MTEFALAGKQIEMEQDLEIEYKYNVSQSAANVYNNKNNKAKINLEASDSVFLLRIGIE